MARFIYLGEPVYPFVQTMGETLVIRVPKSNGTVQEYTPVSPATYFAVGEDMGYDITDAWSLTIMRNETAKFEEIP